MQVYPVVASQMLFELRLRREWLVTEQDDGSSLLVLGALCYLVPYILCVAGVDKIRRDLILVQVEFAPMILESVRKSLNAWY